MLRLITKVAALAVLGFVSVAGTAVAAPAQTYPAPAPVVVSVLDANLSVGGTTTLSGTGCDANEDVAITGGGSPNKIIESDANGSFSTSITLNQVGTFTVTATCVNSGKASGVTITVRDESETTTAPTGAPETTTTAPTGAPETTTVANTDTETSTVAYPDTTTVGYTDATVPAAGGNGANGGNGGNGSGLASTGANIGAPLTFGIALLVVGVGFLLFGTRLAFRRRRRASSH